MTKPVLRVQKNEGIPPGLPVTGVIIALTGHPLRVFSQYFSPAAAVTLVFVLSVRDRDAGHCFSSRPVAVPAPEDTSCRASLKGEGDKNHNSHEILLPVILHIHLSYFRPCARGTQKFSGSGVAMAGSRVQREGI